MSDDDQRAVDTLERVQGGADALVEPGLGILERQVRDQDAMAALREQRRQLVPAGRLVPGAVYQAEGGQLRCTPPASA